MVSKMQRGDTLVEVLMAIVILCIVIVGAITLMARGLSAAQIAVEHTQVRLNTNGQTEMLRFLRDGYLKDSQSTVGQTWLSLFNGTPTYATTTPAVNGATCTVTTNKTGFYLQQDAAGVTVQTFDSAIKPATVALPGQGMWIEATRSANAISPAYVDFQIRACWTAAGTSATQQTVTVERLYDPAH